MKTFRGELMRFFCIIFLIVQFVLTFVCLYAIRSSAIDYIARSHTDSLSMINQRLDMIKNSSQTILNLFSDNSAVNKALNAPFIRRSKLAEMSAYIYSEKLKSSRVIEEMNLPFYITVLGYNEFKYTSQPGKEYYDYDQIKKQPWYKSLCASRSQEPVFVSNVIDRDFLGHDRRVFVAAQNCFGEWNLYRGSILVCIKENVFYQSYKDLLNEDTNIYIVDADGLKFGLHYEVGTENRHVRQSTADFLSSDKPYDIQTIDGRRTLVTKMTSDITDWTIVKEVSLEAAYGSFDTVMYRVAFTIMAFTVLMIAVIYMLTLRMTRPLRQLNTAISNVGQRKQERIPVDHHYLEISQLCSSFNSMQDRITGLLHKIQENEAQIRETELNFLRAQINPHFLYNTLFSIKCTVEMGKEEEASKMLSLLISILRSSLSVHTDASTLLEEFSNLQTYISLQQLRYGSKLTYRIDLPQELEQAAIMRNLLQPIVENAIFHGIEPKGGVGEITITAEAEDGKLIIAIHNDGVDIPPEKLSTLLCDTTPSKKGHIGLQNVHSRIQLYYGEAYGLSIVSGSGQGTTVTVTLPILKSDGGNLLS